jgi:hypothetical protein
MRWHQRNLRFHGVLGISAFERGLNDTPVKDACLVQRYLTCKSYRDVEAVDVELLGLNPGSSLRDLVELHSNYPRRW